MGGVKGAYLEARRVLVGEVEGSKEFIDAVERHAVEKAPKSRAFCRLLKSSSEVTCSSHNANLSSISSLN